MQTSAHWDWLMGMHCSQKTTFHFLSVLTSTHLFYQHETIFVGYFWLVTNALKIYFSDVSETSQDKHLFWDVFETSLLRCFRDVFEMEIWLRHLRHISYRLGNSESFKRFQYFNFERNFLENKNLSQKTGVQFFSLNH